MLLKYICAGALAISLVPAAMAKPVRLNPGQWLVEINAEAIGYPSAASSNTMNQCMRPNEAMLEPSTFAAALSGGAGCSSHNVRQSGNTITFDMSCTEGEVKSGTITMVNQYDSFTMTGSFQTRTDGAPSITIELDVAAHRTGACVS